MFSLPPVIYRFSLAMLKHYFLSLGFSLFCSVSLGLLFASCASGKISFDTLTLPAVVPVVFIISSVLAILISPLTAWAFRHMHFIPAGILIWLALAFYLWLVAPRDGGLGLCGVIILAILGLVSLGIITRRTQAARSVPTNQTLGK
jgi:hypothetical protein